MKIYSYSTVDEKIFAYDTFTEEQVQVIAADFPSEIFFVLSEREESLLTEVERPPIDNLKSDFIYFTAKINAASYWECTCGNFLETDLKGEDRMLKKVVKHARKTGHVINPRGN